MAISLIGLLLFAVFVVSLRSGGRRTAHESLGTAVRRFFQFAVQFALVVIVAIGLSSLLGRVLQRDVLVASDRDVLAQGLAFTLVGIPLLWLIGRWTMRRIAVDPNEAASMPWAWYLALGELVPLTVFALAAQDVLTWAVRAGSYDGNAIARTFVWGFAWLAHWNITRRTTPQGALNDHQLAGAAFGLWTAAFGLASFIASVAHASFLSSTDTLFTGGDPIARSGVAFVVGGAIWFLYWVRMSHAAVRSLHWHVYVMLVGVAAGLAAAIVSLSVVLYDVLVWAFGTPTEASTSLHFSSSMTASGSFAAGVLVWWYHRAVLREVEVTERDEAQRVYEYLVAIISLVAASVGIVMLLVAFIESLTASAQIAGAGAGNTLLLATTLLVVGAPLWWCFWRTIRRAAKSLPAEEAASPVRRVYLFMLFGAVGVAALIALLVAAYQLFVDLVSGNLGLATLRNMRWGIGILAMSAAVAAYHWQVYQGERDLAPEARRGRILLIGAPDRSLEGSLEQSIGARVDIWTARDARSALWSLEAVLEAVHSSDADDVVVVEGETGLRAIAVERR